LRFGLIAFPQGTLEIASHWVKACNELRIDLGPGYRIYIARLGSVCVLLLCGGDKRKQSSDIEQARDYLKDYKKRTGTP